MKKQLVVTPVRTRAKQVAEQCENAYSADRYGSWPAVAEALLRYGFTEREAEAIMRSKWTRWAADHWESKPSDDGRVPAKALIDYIGTGGGMSRESNLASEVRELVQETFPHYDERCVVTPEDYADMQRRLNRKGD